MSPVRLSICISTLNRAAYLGETLESIMGQLTDEVEVLVLDGASTDNTPELMKRFEERCPGLRYLRLEESRYGFDEKYCKLVELARGDYCWLFADDDLIKPGAVAAVLEATRKNYSLIIVNAEVRTPEFAICLQARRVNLESDRIYSPASPDRDHLLADTCSYLTYIGALVIKREVWLQQDTARYYGSMFVHVGGIFQKPLPGDALMMAYPWIVIRYGMALWTAKSFEIWMFKFPELVWSFHDFADWAKQRVVHREPWRRLHLLLMARAANHYTLDLYRLWLKPRLSPSAYKILSYLIAVTPAAPLNFLARAVVKWVFRKSPSITLYDLETRGPAKSSPKSPVRQALSPTPSRKS